MIPTGLVGPRIYMFKSHLSGLLCRGLWTVRLCDILAVTFYHTEGEEKTLKVSLCELENNCVWKHGLTCLLPYVPYCLLLGKARVVLCGVSYSCGFLVTQLGTKSQQRKADHCNWREMSLESYG